MLIRPPSPCPSSFRHHSHSILEAEGSGGHHSLTRTQLALNSDPLPLPYPGNHDALVDDGVGGYHEHSAAVSGEHHRRVGDNKRLELHSNEHSRGGTSSREELSPRIGHPHDDFAG